MKTILTRCGYRCDLCLAYRHHPDNNPAGRHPEKVAELQSRMQAFTAEVNARIPQRMIPTGKNRPRGT